jgi:lipopolysaccharide/colanic/teichoic acid biosynthesis glycosyltransferase
MKNHSNRRWAPRRDEGSAAGTGGSDAEWEFLSEKAFARSLCLERKRAERSNNRFILMLVDFTGVPAALRSKRLLTGILHSIAKSTRETDVKGWHRDRYDIGIIFTEVGQNAGTPEVLVIGARITRALEPILRPEEIKAVRFRFHVFPDDSDNRSGDGELDSVLYPELWRDPERTTAQQGLKRAIDVAGSLLFLALALPLMILIAAAVKATSRGPVIFRQTRLGRGGREFMFFKFRTMYVDSDSAIHREYMMQLIAGDCEGAAAADDDAPVFKMQADPRITRVGRILRRTSLDELPQLFNVLKGDMSLVGPRPPIPYEVQSYAHWHRRRLLVIPGITGLWQVRGRNLLKFDDMVRLDLQYVETGTVIEDLRILWQTPRAVFFGNGAC